MGDAELLARLDKAQKFCFDIGLRMVTLAIQDARAALSRAASLPPQVQGDVVVWRRVVGGEKPYLVDGALLRDMRGLFPHPGEANSSDGGVGANTLECARSADEERKATQAVISKAALSGSSPDISSAGVAPGPSETNPQPVAWQRAKDALFNLARIHGYQLNGVELNEAVRAVTRAVGWPANPATDTSAVTTDAVAAERQRCATVVLEQRCERGTPWDLACTTIANALVPGIVEHAPSKQSPEAARLADAEHDRQLLIGEMKAQSERARRAEAQLADWQEQVRTSIRLRQAADARLADAYAALRSLAEGNLGDASWQANYETIKQVARNALPRDPAPDRVGCLPEGDGK